MTLGISIGSNPITGVYVGSTLATGVYLGSTKVWPVAASGITLIGVCGLNGSASTVKYTLPSGAAANDVVVCGFAFNSASGNTLTPPANAVALVNGVSTSNMQAYLYRIPLSATDITNGYVEFGWAGSQTAFIPGAVFRDVSISQPLDGTVSQGLQSAPTALPFSATAPGITTTTPGAALVQFAAMTPTSADGGMVMGVPSGWTNLNTQAPLQIDATMNYLAQTSPGATGAISSACTGSAGTQASWGAWLFALRPTTPAITLSATFPSSPHVGDAISFDVTATLVDGATGTPTITVDQLPAGLLLGSTSMVDATHYKATVSGTLTTAQDITGSFGTTGGSPNATPLAHEFNVQAAGSLALVQTQAIIRTPASTTPVNLTLTNVQVGDQIVLVATLYGATSNGATFSDSAENTYTTTAAPILSGQSCFMQAALATASAAAASLTVSVDPTKSSYVQFTAYLLRGGTLVMGTAAGGNSAGLAPGGTFTAGPYSTSGRAFIATALDASATGATVITDTSSGYTRDSAGSLLSTNVGVSMHKLATTAITNESFTFGSDGTATQHLYYAVFPFTY